MSVKGKNVFITGSTRGIGKAIAERFAKNGANVVINGRKEIAVDFLAELTQMGIKATSVVGDIADFAQAEAMILEAEERLGSLDVLVNNAGITNDKLLLRMSEEDFEKVLKVNLTGTFNMTQAVLKKMLKRRTGTIINMSSVVGLMGNIGQANYAASKAGVIGFTKAVAREVASRKITVNAIAPGFIQTEMTDSLSEKAKEMMRQQIPLKRLGLPSDVAKVVIFLAEADYLTGQVISVDGGLVMNG
ncbi:MAG: 3-oxoacyl-[acyl-carrier-protein] reductase [Streptococcaceae bacterium]|jgi:3-oxoacyl-[acyl-carrier protein] reductase|nr:3-oxoacyl-[acyl-carrier-protein] reductase [Streptococcaceae bacterium]